MKQFAITLAIILFLPHAQYGQETLSLPKIDDLIRTYEKSCGGLIGVGVRNIQSGEEYIYRSGTGFPLASTLKIPVAVSLLKSIEQGKLSLTDQIEFKKSDFHPGSGIIVKYFEDPGLSLSVKDLLKLMLTESDNTAADICIREAGGTKEINKVLRNSGITGMSVDRPTYVGICKYMGVEGVVEEVPYNDKLVVQGFRTLTKEKKEQAAKDFFADGKDQSTVDAMLNLLCKIWEKELLNTNNTDLLLSYMKKCNTGANRIIKLLPENTVVYHKTGSIGSVTNDVGIISLPENYGDIAIVVFIKEATVDTAASEKIIAEISRILYDYFSYLD